MRTVSTIAIAFWMCVQAACGATIHLEVEVDKATYFQGQTVNWTILAWADSGDNAGIAAMTVNLNDDQNESLSSALLNGADLADTEYGTPEGFAITLNGVPAAAPPRLQDIIVAQFPNARVLNIGNDDAPHILCKGSYAANVLGAHTLTATLGDADYWPDGVASAVQFENSDTTPVLFDVIAEPTFCGDTNTVYLAADLAMPQDCYVNLADFAVVNQHWLENTCMGPTWCSGTDIDESGDVGLPDLELWAGQWLWCTNPADSSCDIYWK